MTDPWFQRGLRFECTRCGLCCTGTPGTVRVSDDEIAALARRLKLSDAEFRGLHTRRLRGGERSLRERRGGDCVFYEEGRCSVHEDRPRQCRSYPFWSASLHSAETWAAESAECEGIGRGPLWRADQIETLRRNDGTFGSRRRKGAR